MLTYQISPDRTSLTITADAQTRAELQEIKSQDEKEDIDVFVSDDSLQEAFESMISNSSLEWVEPSDCGAMTAAPLLGFYGESTPVPVEEGVASHDNERGGRFVGCWDNAEGVLCHWYEEVDEVWGYAPYALRSPLEDLLETGEVQFVASF